MTERATVTHYPPVSSVKAGLTCTCPRCGRGKLFDGVLKVADRCGVCGLDLTTHDAGDGPAVFVIFILGFVVVPLALLLEVVLAPPIWVHLVVWTPVIFGGTVALLRPTKAWLVAQRFKHDAGTHDVAA